VKQTLESGSKIGYNAEAEVSFFMFESKVC
jgi:hypothetical protein